MYGEKFDTLDLIVHRAEDHVRWLEGLQALVPDASDRCAIGM